MKIERKSFPAIVTKVDQAKGIVEGIVAVLGNLDDGNDIIQPGAFVKTIAERASRIRVLDQHNTDSILRVLGKPLEMREVGQAELPAELLARCPEATGGLWTRTQFLLETPEGKGAFIRIAEGAVSEWSIGFEALDMDYSKVLRDGKQVTARNLKTIRLWEYSPVLWGMNPATATVDAKDGPAKEMTPDGPIRRMGDVLVGSMRQVCHKLLDQWQIDGRLDEQQYQACLLICDQQCAGIASLLPADVATQESGNDFYWFSRGGVTDRKAGARHSSADMKALQSIHDSAVTLGAMCPEGDKAASAAKAQARIDSAKAGPGETPPVTGATPTGPGSTPPTSSELQAIELEQLAISLALLEV